MKGRGGAEGEGAPYVFLGDRFFKQIIHSNTVSESQDPYFAGWQIGS